MGTTRSGWCLRPLTESSKSQHDKCPKNFATGGTCGCECSHPSERVREDLVEGRDWPSSWRAQLDGRAGVGVSVVEVDKPAQEVYSERVPAAGGAAALQALHKGASHEQPDSSPATEP